MSVHSSQSASYGPIGLSIFSTSGHRYTCTGASTIPWQLEDDQAGGRTTHSETSQQFAACSIMNPVTQRNKAYQRVQRMAAYLPLAGTAVILVIQSLYSDFFRSFSLTLACATLAISLTLLIWYLEERLHRFSGTVDSLVSEVKHFGEEQPRLLGEASSNFQVTQLGKAFEVAAGIAPQVHELRVYAISSAQIVNFITHNNFEIDKCQLLVQRVTDNRELFSQVVEVAINDWRKLLEAGKIRELEVLRYDYHPTDYECIFDSKFLILGLFGISDDYSGISVREPMIVHAQSLAGARIISEYTARFDILFEACRDRFGDNDDTTVFTYTGKEQVK
jgi:hypothetical protein